MALIGDVAISRRSPVPGAGAESDHRRSPFSSDIDRTRARQALWSARPPVPKAHFEQMVRPHVEWKGFDCQLFLSGRLTAEPVTLYPLSPADVILPKERSGPKALTRNVNEPAFR